MDDVNKESNNNKTVNKNQDESVALFYLGGAN